MTSDSAGSSGASTADGRGKRLDSWKEIAAYLNRHVTTVRRWEKQEGLPVHRHVHHKLGSVYAWGSELDVWLEGRDPEDVGIAALPALPRSSGRTGQLPRPPALTGVAVGPVSLVGRDTELDALGNAWGATRRGQQQVVLIAGEPASGKTRLVLEFASSAANEARVLVGRCDSEAIQPFAPFVEMIQWLVRATPPDTLRRWLTDIDGGIELAQLAPEIIRHIPAAQQSIAPTGEGRRYRMFEACAHLLERASRDDAILFLIEDIHWADEGTLLLLRHLIRSTREAPICIIATFRDAEPGHSLRAREMLADLRREASVTEMALTGLSEDHVRSLIEAWTGRAAPPWLAQFIVTHSEGNPLFATELLRHLDDTGGSARAVSSPELSIADVGLPHGIRDLIGCRLARLSPACQALLTPAAVAGREFNLSVIEAVTTLPEEAMLDALDEAVAARIITEEQGAPGRFAFVHTLIRETLYASMTGARRVRLHHRMAEAIERLADRARLPLGELAHHFGQAAVFRDTDKAIDYAIRAGDHALAVLALEESARYYGMALHALGLLPSATAPSGRRLELHVRRGRSLFLAGQWTLARAEFEIALSLLDPVENDQRCELLVRLAEASFWLMDTSALRTFAGEAQLLAERLGRDDLWSDAVAWLSSAKVADGDVLGGIESDRQALARAGGIRSFGLARIPLTLYWAGRTAEAVERGAEAVGRARASGDPAFLLYALQHWGLSLSGAGRYDEALEVFDEARTFGRRCGALPLLARATSMSVAPLLSLGDLDGALTRALEARELAHRIGFEPPLVSAGIDLLLIFARLQDPARAESLLAEVERAVHVATGWHAWKWRLRLWHARAELALARGSLREAIVAADHVVDQSRPRCRLKYEALGLAARARARGRLGLRQAVDDGHAAVDVARRLADPAVLLECLAVVVELDGNDACVREVRQTAHRMLGALSHESLRTSFLTRVSAKVGAVVDS